MKTISIEQIVEDVRIKYDEILLNESNMMDTEIDDDNFNIVVKSCIDDAYRFVVNNADLSMLEGKQLENGELRIDENLVAHIKLPNDFLRGLTFRLTSWQSSSSDIITEESPEYRMQSDPYACGTFQNPIAAIVHTASGREIELYKAKSQEDKLKSFLYMPSLSKEDKDVKIPDQLLESFIYYVAGLTATTFREDVANDFFKVAKGLLGIE